MEFDASARELLRHAIYIALASDSAEVDCWHLLLAADSPEEASVQTRDIDFSQAMRIVLAEALVLAQKQTPPQVSRSQLLTTAERHTICAPREIGSELGDLLNPNVCEILESKGVKTEGLVERLRHAGLKNMPELATVTTEAGRKFLEISLEFGNRTLSSSFLTLLCGLGDDSAASRVLKEAGVTESVLLEILEELREPNLWKPRNLEDTFPWCKLSREVIQAFSLAWKTSPTQELGSSDLLPALLYKSGQDQNSAWSLLEKIGALEQIAAGIDSNVRLFAKADFITTAPELRAVLERAALAAGEGPVETGHLLLALAEKGHPLLAHLSEQIHQQLQAD